MKNIPNLNIEGFKDSALKKASSKTYFAIGLILLSLIAALAITNKANHTISVWSATFDVMEGDIATTENTEEISVFLPTNSKNYLRTSVEINGLVLTRRVSAGDLISKSSLTELFSGEARKSVPIKVAKNDLPNDLIAGQSVDLYVLPNPNMNSQRIQPAELVTKSVIVESIDLKSKEMGGDIGIVLKIINSEILELLTSLTNGRIVVVRSAI